MDYGVYPESRELSSFYSYFLASYILLHSLHFITEA